MKRRITFICIVTGIFLVGCSEVDPPAQTGRVKNCDTGQFNPDTGQCEQIDTWDGPDGRDDPGDPDIDQGNWTDGDRDGVPNQYDNCPNVANSEQKDADSDGYGNPCDNCPQISNTAQRDSNNDGQGDVCTQGSDNASYDPSTDTDGDGVRDLEDNCPETPNPEQTDSDDDGRGDKCDNCPNKANYNQVDLNDNGTGDACEVPPPSTQFCSEGTIQSNLLKPNVFVNLDYSGSMLATDSDSTTRWQEAINAVDAVKTELTEKFNVGLGRFPASRECAGNTCDFSDTSPQCPTPNICAYGDRCTSGNGVSPHFCPAPDPDGCSAPLPSQLLELSADNSSSDIENTISGLNPPLGRSGTPLAVMLQDLYNKRKSCSNGESIPYYDFCGDQLRDERSKAIVMFTDGCPTCQGNSLEDTKQAARQLREAGYTVYLIGYKIQQSTTCDSVELQEIAEAGGSKNPSCNGGSDGCNRDWYLTENTNQIISALDQISSSEIGCSLQIEPGSDTDLSRIRVQIRDGQQTQNVPPSNWALDRSNNTIEVTGNSCDTLKQKARDAANTGREVGLKAEIACQNCESSEEVCDYRDNDCDKEIDEGCDGCSPEVCDGTDNDCDGDVDENCPECKINGASCSTDSECCHDSCVDGTCQPPCRPLGVSCQNDSDCCGGSCAATSGTDLGTCVSN